MNLTYKYRLKDRSAKKLLRQHAYACNQVWNWCVAQHRDTQDRYRAGGPARRWASHFDLTKYCKGVGAMLGIHQQTVGSVCEQFAKSRDQHKCNPRFRSSYGTGRALGWVPFQTQSRRLDGNSVIYLGRRFRFFGNKRRPLPENAKGGYFVEDTRGRWWVCFHVDVEAKPVAQTGEIGVDLGLKTFAATSEGEKVVSLPHYRLWQQRLAVAQRAGNKKRVAAINSKIANARRDQHHKLSRRLAGEYALIAVGNVNAKKLAKTRMAKSVNDAGWSTFRTMLRYKAGQYVEVDEKFTTQTCSSCGTLPPERPKGIAGLGVREWECSSCGASHDRDVNAARNILALALSAQRPVEESRRAA